MATYAADWKDKNNANIFKARQGSVFLGPDDQAIPAALTSTASATLIALPAGWADLGWTSTDGAQFGRDVENSDVTSWGSVEPTRRDVVRDVETIQVTCQELKKATLEAYTGATMPSALVTTSEVIFDKPAVPAISFNRLLVVAVDENDGGEIYVAYLYPRVSVTDFAEQQFAEGDDPVTFGVTFTGYEDATLGYSKRTYIGGPGWKPTVVTGRGFTQGV